MQDGLCKESESLVGDSELQLNVVYRKRGK
jgi:hypothetical protein